ITIVTSANNNFNGVANTLRPDVVGEVPVTGDPNHWFDASLCDPRLPAGCSGASLLIPVSSAGVFHFGSLGRNTLTGPSFFNTDVSLVKNTKVAGNARLQFRLEAFNVFNHPNLGQPG